MSVQPASSMAPCVILAPADHPLDELLPRLLAERGWSARVEHDARMAMAEACLVRRDMHIRHAWDDQQIQFPGIILAVPERCGDVDALRNAMRNHVPDIPIWKYDGTAIIPLEGTDPQLRPEVPDPVPDIQSPIPFKPEPLTHEEVSMLLHGKMDSETT